MRKTVKTYKAAIVEVDNDFSTVIVAETEYTAPSDALIYAKKALKESGVEVPRGAKIKVVEQGTKVYECSTEEFLSVAHEVDADEDVPFEE